MRYAVIAVIALALYAHPAMAASFDCAKASTAIENTICGDAELSRLDEALGEAYAEAREISASPKDLKSRQRAWLRNTRSACADAACLKSVYKARIAELTALVPAATQAAPAKQKLLRITNITPSGENVPASRQIVFQFNRPVVPIGRMDRSSKEIPIEISPALACQWRWINTSALSCQLGEGQALRLATDYSIVVRPGIRAEDGATIKQELHHDFSTRRPRVGNVRFRTWRSPGLPIMQVTFTQAVTRESVEEHLFLTQSGNSDERITLTVEPDPNPRTQPRYFLTPDHEVIVDFGEPREQGVDDSPAMLDGKEVRRVWLVKPVRELPLDSAMDMIIEPGLVSAAGPKRGDETRPVIRFNTFPEFRFIGIACTPNRHQTIMITPQNASDSAKCGPSYGVALLFSTPVINTEVRDHMTFEPPLSGGLKDYDPWANRPPHSRLGQPHRQGRNYSVALPTALKAFEEYRISTGDPAAGPKDEFGRSLPEPIDLSFFTDHRLPNYRLIHDTAVLEKGVDSQVPLYVTNIETATAQYRRLTRDSVVDDLLHHPAFSDVADIQYGVPLGIREMLEGKLGLVYGHLTTIPNPGRHPTTFLGMVTPWQIQVKAGHFNSLVWVTDLATGKPVAGASVQVYKEPISGLTDYFAVLDKATTDAFGTAAFGGLKELDPTLATFRSCGLRFLDDCPRLIVRVEKGEDFALLPLDRRFEADASRVSNNMVRSYSRPEYGHVRSWGTTAQGVYRAGDTIQYKIYVRDVNNESLAPAPDHSYKLEIVDPTGKIVHTEADLELSDFGGYSSSYQIPESGAVGWYQFRLTPDFIKQTWTPMRVLVADFTPSSFGVSVDLNGDLFGPGDEVVAESRATLFSGGPYTDAETRVTATLRSRGFSSRHPQTASFRFDSYNNRSSQTLLSKTGQMGDDGALSESFRLTEEAAKGIIYGTVEVESAVRDDRGKYVAAQARADFIGVDRLVGLKSPRWIYKAGEAAEIPYVVVDGRGAPAAGTPVQVNIERQETKAARVKGAGNAYLTQFVESWESAGHCDGVSENAPLSCNFTPKKPGRYRLTAEIQDSKGRPHKTVLGIWVTGPGRVVWQQRTPDRLEIIPEKTAYDVGDTARYLVKNPYPGAKALVTVERYGILKQWVQTLEDSTPVIEFPVEKDFLPGFYLSVVAMSPRVAAPLPKLGEIDLGKPTFRMGYVKVPVTDPYKVLDVTVEPAAEVYRPRDVVKARIHAAARNKDRDEPIEVAVAVLDESVLDLIQGGTRYFDIYRGLYRLDGLDLRNYSLLARLVGRQRIEKKGANQGGDGAARMAMAGASSGPSVNVRELFKFVSYWNPSVRLDDHGNGEIEFEVPDNLTGWRILVMAATPTDRLGLGQGSFKVNRPTEIRPVVPNQITEGDVFTAGFSIMNRTGETREVEVTIKAEGALKQPTSHHQFIHLEPYKRATVGLTITSGRVPVDRDIPAGEIRFTVQARDAMDADAVVHKLPVNKRRSLDVGANYGMIVSPSASESLLFPKDIHPDVGAVDVVLSPSVIGNVDGAFRYLRDYPYICWEQKLTKAVMASHYRNLKSYLPDDLEWPAAEGLPQSTLRQAADYQAPNGGMAYFWPDNMHVSPYLSAYTALAFNWLRDRGQEIPEDVEQRLHGYLQNLIRRDTMPSFYSRGMSSTVRAVALAALSRHGKVNQADLGRYRHHVDYMSLFGKAHFLQAATNVEGASDTVRDVMEKILQSSYQSGGKFSFNEELDDSYSRILATPVRANCAILSSLTQAASKAIDPDQLGDIPFKLVRSLTQTRGARTHWENTQENVFCMNAMIDYSKAFEGVPPDMKIAVDIDGDPVGKAAFADLRDAPVTLSRPIGPDDPGVRRILDIRREGQGRLYYAARMSFALKDVIASRVNAGIDIRKEYSVERNGKWVLLGNPAEIAQGELVRVDIYLSLPTARNFLVVDDPVPGGLEPVNRDLANTSTVDADKGGYRASGGAWWFQYSDWRSYGVSRWSFHHQELRHDSVRFYSDYLPPGNYHLSYAAQAISEGSFVRMPIRAEEMYDPDVYGKGLPGELLVKNR